MLYVTSMLLHVGLYCKSVCILVELTYLSASRAGSNSLIVEQDCISIVATSCLCASLNPQSLCYSLLGLAVEHHMCTKQIVRIAQF
jgi:hypothetical protein